MTAIHPTAVVHPQATLGAGVEVGPYAVIEAGAVLGDGCRVRAHAVITGWVRMGRGNEVGHGAILGGDPQDNAFDPATQSHVTIGDDNRVRELVTIHRGTAAGSETRVGNGCFLMAGVHLGHNVQLADRVIIANNALLGGHVHVGEAVFIGGGSVFHQFVHIGRNAIVQGLSAMSKNIPPFLLACERNRVAGLNTVGLRRSGFTPELRREIKEAFLLLYKSGRNTTQALAAARERSWSPPVEAFFAFVAGSGKRGICSLAGAAGAAGAADF